MENESVMALYHAIKQLRSDSVNGRGVQEQKWLQNQLSDENLKTMIPQLSIIALHILSGLEAEKLTGVALADRLAVTRGGITRAAKKLIQMGLIQATKKPDDQKKIYYSLTAKGRVIAQSHDKMHETLKAQVIDKVTEKYKDAELKQAASLINDLMQFERDFY